MSRLALALLCLAASAGPAWAQAARPPACGSATQGVIWNFGSEARPDIRRCDGTSYVPYAIPCAEGQAAAGAPGRRGQACEEDCANQRRTCDSSCHGLVTDTQCVDRCERAKVQCMLKCD